MKILIYQPRASYYLGGGEVYPLKNACFFAKLGHDVTLLTTRAPFLKQSDYFKNFIKDNPNVKIDYLDLDNSFKDIYDIVPGTNWERWDKESLWVSRLAYQYLSENDFDIIAVHNVIDTLAVPFGKKHILQLHGSPDELNYICKLVLEREHQLIAVSKNVADKWIQLGATPNMVICTNAVDENSFYPGKESSKNNDLLFVGRLIPIKGVQYILEALKILKEKYHLTPNLRIIGDGPYRKELEILAEKFDINNQVTFCGLVSQEYLLKSYQESRVAVLPSYAKEGIMSTLLEASCCRIPTITTKGTSMEEFAGNNENALLVEPENALDISEKIYKLLTDNVYASNLANHAYNSVIKNYTWLAKSKQLLEIYKELL